MFTILKKTLLAALALSLLSAPSYAKVITVSKDTSKTADFRELHLALDAAVDGDEVQIIDQGTYDMPAEAPYLSVINLGKAITLSSVPAGATLKTYIHVYGTTKPVVLKDLKFLFDRTYPWGIHTGWTPGIDLTIDGCEILCDHDNNPATPPTITDAIVPGCQTKLTVLNTKASGAFYCSLNDWGNPDQDSTITVTNCQFTKNGFHGIQITKRNKVTISNTDLSNNLGYGFHATNDSTHTLVHGVEVTMNNCTIKNNGHPTNKDHGHVGIAWGARNGKLTLNDTVISGHQAVADGSAIGVWIADGEGCTVELNRTTITDNYRNMDLNGKDIKVRFDGVAMNNSQTHCLWFFDTTNISGYVKNCTFAGNGSQTNPSGGSVINFNYGPNADLTFSNCTFQSNVGQIGASGADVFLGTIGTYRFDGCKFLDNKLRGFYRDYGGLDANDPSRNVGPTSISLTNCLFDGTPNQHTVNIIAKHPNAACTINVTVRGCTFLNSKWRDISITNGGNATGGPAGTTHLITAIIENNKFANITTGSYVALYGSFWAPGSRVVNNLIEGGLKGMELMDTDVEVYHNTVIGNSTNNLSVGIEFNGNTASTYQAAYIANNIIDNVKTGLVGKGSLGNLKKIDYNLVNVNNSIAGAAAFSGLTQGANNKTGLAPQFVAPSSTLGFGDYHLLANSPAKNAGDPTVGVTKDFDGLTRDAQPDMGAFEVPPPGPNAAGHWTFY